MRVLACVHTHTGLVEKRRKVVADILKTHLPAKADKQGVADRLTKATDSIPAALPQPVKKDQ